MSLIISPKISTSDDLSAPCWRLEIIFSDMAVLSGRENYSYYLRNIGLKTIYREATKRLTVFVKNYYIISLGSVLGREFFYCVHARRCWSIYYNYLPISRIVGVINYHCFGNNFCNLIIAAHICMVPWLRLLGRPREVYIS